MAEQVKTFWLSFCDPDAPAGSQFRGVAIVDVTAEEARAIKPTLPPQHRSGAEWIAAATRKAWQTGCNPGGEVASAELTAEALAASPVELPRNRLMQKPELRSIGLIETEQS